MSPTHLHPNTSPYLMYDKFHVDAFNTPMLPFGTIVVAQYPLALQTTLTGRGFEAMVLGRATNYHDGIKLLNTKTHRTITRRTYRVIGDKPIHGFLYEKPLILEIHPHDDIPNDTISQLLTIDSQPTVVDLPTNLNETLLITPPTPMPPPIILLLIP